MAFGIARCALAAVGIAHDRIDLIKLAVNRIHEARDQLRLGARSLASVGSYRGIDRRYWHVGLRLFGLSRLLAR